jgi:carbonic anhydrase
MFIHIHICLFIYIGGVITPGDIRSLAISQRLLGTKEIILIHHTDCGMLTFTDDAFKAQLCQEIGQKPHWSPESFTNLHDDIRQSINRIKSDPFVPLKDNIRGFIYDVHTGGLEEVLPKKNGKPK